MTNRSTSHGMFFLLFIFSAIVLSGCSNWSQSKVVESQRRGDVIIAALQAHYADQGDYPPTLAILVPNYLAAIELPTAGTRKWHYTKYQENDSPAFNLYFDDGESIAKERYYLSSVGAWQESDGSF